MVLLALIFLLTLFDSTSALTVANEELHYTGPVISDFEELPGFAYSGTSIETWSSYEEAVAGCLSDENCHGFYSRDFTTFDKGSCSLENPNCCHSVGETVPYTGECNSSGELKFGSHCDCKVLTEHSQWTAWVKSKKLLCPAVSGVAGCNQWATNSVNALNGADFPAIKDQAECREKCALSKDCTSYMLHPTHGCALYKTLDGCTGNHGWTGYQMNCGLDIEWRENPFSWVALTFEYAAVMLIFGRSDQSITVDAVTKLWKEAKIPVGFVLAENNGRSVDWTDVEAIVEFMDIEVHPDAMATMDSSGPEAEFFQNIATNTCGVDWNHCRAQEATVAGGLDPDFVDISIPDGPDNTASVASETAVVAGGSTSNANGAAGTAAGPGVPDIDTVQGSRLRRLLKYLSNTRR